jgi:two-component system, cell cycle sensor histidine kinase and response regulator CckA
MSSAQRASRPGTDKFDKTADPRQAHTSPGSRTDSARRSALRILIVEDQPTDAELEQRLLTRAGLDFTAVVVDTRESFLEQLAAFRPEVILSDFSLPGFSGESALKIVQEQCSGIPFIILSGELGDEAAVELIRQGATDYVLKDRPARLASVVRRAVAEAEQRAERAELEGQLHRSQRLEGIGRLAAGVAHDFNNMVGAMLNYAAFIRGQAAERVRQGIDKEAWDGVRQDAEQIEDAGQRVIQLVHQLLAAGGQELVRPELIDLSQVVTGIEELLRSTVGRHIEFHLSLAPRPWLVTADQGQIKQVLLNLAMNAREAMPAGGTFSIDTQNVTTGQAEGARHPGLTPGAYVCLCVRDSGIGMEPGILEHVGEPFFTTKPFVEGGGLGLASVYGIISQAGGAVGISSEPGIGTIVTAWLPAAPAHPPA